MTPAVHIVNLSGGKDSQACALLAAERGRPFRLVMADTGNEHQATIDHAHLVAEHVGQPLEIVRADFTDRIAAKREAVRQKWTEEGVNENYIRDALDVLQPTGIPFLDLCLWKGRFPSRMAQFCTEHLKSEAIQVHVTDKILSRTSVVHWLGVRRDESPSRRAAPMFQLVRQDRTKGDALLFRPIIHWTAENVVGFSQAHGLPLNPLYSEGMSRVGCFPCINAGKDELAEIHTRFPEATERVREWERLVAMASKRSSASFFEPGKTPEGADMQRELKRLVAHRLSLMPPFEKEADRRRAEKLLISQIAPNFDWPKIDSIMDWATTTGRGGRNRLLPLDEPELGCSSHYGLCE